jgi:photosystem II stability/assembly factor-like uncharacterized protein
MSSGVHHSAWHSPKAKLALIGLIFLLLLIQRAASSAAEPPSGHFGPSHSSPALEAHHTFSSEGKQGLPLLSSDRHASAPASEAWHSYPITGGEMLSIVTSPVETQTVYVGTRDAGVFKTTNGGQSWQPARNGLTFFPIRSLQIDPQHPNTLYAGTDNNGLWKSTDGGETWADSSSGLDKSLIVLSIVMDPQNTNTLYAGLAGGPGQYIGHIYKSQNGGASWVLQDTDIPLEVGTYINGVFALAIDLATPSTVYAGTNYAGAFRSTDGGAHWAPINSGLPPWPGWPNHWKTVQALAADPHHAHRLGAMIQGGYYTFENDQWQKVCQDACDSDGGSYLSFHPTDPSTLYSAGDSFKISTNGGITWTQRLGWPDSGHVTSIAFHPSTPDTIYAATDVLFDYVGGVYTSTDQGKTWSEASQGITAQRIYGVAIDPQNSNNIYAGTGDGFFYRSQDGGVTWSRGYYTINPYPYQEKVYDFGPISEVAVDPLNSHKIYIATTNFYMSTDYGETFYKTDAVTSPFCIAIPPYASGPIYVGGGLGYGIYKSSDGGITWEQKKQGLPLFGGSINPILSLAIDPNITSTVWAGTQYGGGILKSADGGEHWQVKGLTETNFVDAIAVNPANSNEILAGGGYSEGRIYKSTDGGNTWQVKVSGIAFVQDIVYDPRNPRWVYAATEGYGVLRSFNGGESWFDYSAGIFYPVTYSLAITQDDPPLLIAGSYGSGLYWTHPLAPKEVFLPMMIK